jgi:DNA repair photolyase
MTTKQKLPPTGRITLYDVHASSERFHHRGRGAVSNHSGRYETASKEAFDDGWGTVEEDAPKLVTELTAETAKSIITHNQTPDISFDRSINPYRGCEHGCVYCFARPSHTWLGLSAGLDFESKLTYKPNAPDLLRKALANPRYRPKPIALGVNTDAYQPVERKTGLTRELLKILSEHNHPVSLLSKSALIERDLDILEPMARKGLVRVGISITTLNRALARKLEPRAATPSKRLATVTALSNHGVPTSVMMAPIIPALTDHEIETLLEAAKQAGAMGAGYVLLRLPNELKDLFHEWLAEHYPDRAARIINQLRAIRGGKDYDARWFERGRGTGVYAQMIAKRFARARRNLDLDSPRPNLIEDLFVGDMSAANQLELGL